MASQSINELLELALANQKSGALDSAEAIYRQVLDCDPKNVDANHLLAQVCLSTSRPHDAIHHARAAMALRPDIAEIYISLAKAYRAANDLETSVRCYKQALDIEPARSDVHNNLGNLLKIKGDLFEAARHFQKAIEIDPLFAEVHNNLANTLLDLGRPEDAVTHYHQALDINPDFFEAHQNLGNAFRQLNRHNEAVKSYRQALAIAPRNAKIYYNLGNAYKEQGQLKQAAGTYNHSLSLNPNQPLLELRIATMCPTIFSSSEEMNRYERCITSSLKKFRDLGIRVKPSELSRPGAQPPYNWLFLNSDLRVLRNLYAEIFRNSIPKMEPNPKANHNKVRVGFLVPEGYEAVFLRCMRGILRQINASRFERFIIGSPIVFHRMKTFLEQNSIDFLGIPSPLDKAAETIHAASFDILYHWEIGTNATNYFLPFFRLAPVQCTSWGLPVTTGIPNLDYYISSELIETENSQSQFSEKLVSTHSLLTYHHEIKTLKSTRKRDEFGLPNDKNIYLCVQQLGKIHPDFDQIISQILQRDAHGILVLVEDKSIYAAKFLKQRFQRELPDVCDQIRFLPRQHPTNYMSLIACADVILDTFPWGSGLTCYDALSLGKPIVTLPSKFSRGRLVQACYRNMDLTECIAADWDDYVQIALSLGCDQDHRKQLSKEIAAASEALFEDSNTVEEFEQILEQMVTTSKRQH